MQYLGYFLSKVSSEGLELEMEKERKIVMLWAGMNIGNNLLSYRETSLQLMAPITARVNQKSIAHTPSRRGDFNSPFMITTNNRTETKSPQGVSHEPFPDNSSIDSSVRNGSIGPWPGRGAKLFNLPPRDIIPPNSVRSSAQLLNDSTFLRKPTLPELSLMVPPLEGSPFDPVAAKDLGPWTASPNGTGTDRSGISPPGSFTPLTNRSTSTPRRVAKTGIPVQVLAMRQTGKDIKKDKKDFFTFTLIDLSGSSSQKGLQKEESEEISVAAAVPITYYNPKGHLGLRARLYQSKVEIISDPHVALKRMLSDHLIGSSAVDSTPVTVLDQPDDTQSYLLIDEMIELLRSCWLYYRPGMRMLTVEEKKETEEQLLIW